jgi:hypothetical protein
VSNVDADTDDLRPERCVLKNNLWVSLVLTVTVALSATASASIPEAPTSDDQKALEAELEKTFAAPDVAEPPPAPPKTKMLPDISAVLTGLFGWFAHEPTPRPEGHDPVHTTDGFVIQLQELEIALQSTIDPYFRADLYLAATLEGIELEEAFFTSLNLPVGLQLRVGLFFATLGRFNTQHFLEVHPFVDTPLVNRRFFGSEQLKGLGAELSWLMPLPWYAVVTADFLTANNPVSLGIPVESTRGLGDFLTVLHLRQSFDLADTWSLTWGLSYAQAGNASGGEDATDVNRTTFAGTDLYLKWRDARGRTSVGLTVEYLLRRATHPGATATEGGLYAMVDAHLTPEWQVATRFDWLGVPNTLDGAMAFEGDLAEFAAPSRQWRAGAAVSYSPSEFQRWRLQYNVDQVLGGPGGLVPASDVNHEIFLQYQGVIGVHGAHPF